MASLAEVFPSFAEEWDFARNGYLTPDQVSVGSHIRVYWICPRCGQSYKMRVSNRTAPSRIKKNNKCPICQGRVIIPGYNSLKAVFPSIVDLEWDYENNSIDPDTIAPHSNKTYYWICTNGHHYTSKLNNKVNGNGGNCPYCSHQKLLPEYSLAIVNPALASEWDYEINKGLTPHEVFVNSNKTIGWICHRCGFKWNAKVVNRNNGRGCPNCAKGHHTSFPEQVVFHYVKYAFPDAINSHKVEGVEIDVFIPSIKTGIEYDGENYHRTAHQIRNDIKKSKILKSSGINLIRIRESGCNPIDSSLCDIIIFDYTTDYRNLEPIVQKLIEKLCSQSNKVCDVKVDIPSVRNQILSKVNTISWADSFAGLIYTWKMEGKKSRALWDYEENYPLTPNMVMPFSEIRVSWICPNNPSHKWVNTIKSVSLGYGCSKCSKRYHRSPDEWIEKAKEIHGGKYDYSKTIFTAAKNNVTIICRKHGEFKQLASDHLAGKGCKYCSHQVFHPSESLSVISPTIAKQWDYEKNNNSGYTPDSIGINSTILFWWHCTKGKPHSFRATIAKRVKGNMQCAVCHGKQFAYDRSLEFIHPELASEWCKENLLKPSEVTCGQEDKVLWKCKNPNHPEYWASIYNRAHLHSGCPLCAREKKK